MARTMIDIDEALLAAAAEELGTTTKRSTVEAALRLVAGKAARRRLGELIAETGATPKELDAARMEAWR